MKKINVIMIALIIIACMAASCRNYKNPTTPYVANAVTSVATGVSFTPTKTPTFTPTFTEICSITVTCDASITKTPSLTCTITETSVISATQIQTQTCTEEDTQAPSLTCTMTETQTCTEQDTQTPTPSMTFIVNPTSTKTYVPSATGTMLPVSDTPTITITMTESPVVSSTMTVVCSITMTQTFTDTCTASVTPTFTKTLTQIITPTFTITPTIAVFMWNCVGPGITPVNTPLAIAVDNNNNGVYVTEFYNPTLGTFNYMVQEYDFNGNPITQWGSIGSGNGQFNGDTMGFGIAVDNTGAYIYVVDTGNNRVQKFDTNGNYISQWGTAGTGNGQFNGPNWVAVDNTGSIYVSDNGNDRIQKFDSNENYISQWGTSGSGSGQFSLYDGGGSAGGIAVYNAGSVLYVADTGNNRIQKFDLNGNYLLQWGSLGTGNGQFRYPCGIAVNNTGYVFVSDTFNDDTNNIWYNRIEEFDSMGNYIAQWGVCTEPCGNNFMQFFNPEGIAINNAGSVFVADSGNSRIQRFTP